MHSIYSNYQFKLSLALISFLLMSLPVFGKMTGKVLMVRGDVTALQPGKTKADKLSNGMVLASDSSVYAQKKSFAKIKLTNGSVLTVGPMSKVVIETSGKDDTSMVSLLTGKIRAKVKKDLKNDKKVLIKTTSAVMGVRGTDFQATFNHSANRTSLLTFEGKVAIKKIDDVTSTKITNSKKNRVQQVKDMIKNDDQSVGKGDYVNVAQKSPMEKPIKINPVQYVVLKKDDSLGVTKSKITQKEVMKEARSVAKEFKKDTKGSKAGNFGFIDTKSGIYVPPMKIGDKKMVGKIDINGNYIPPKGLKIDEKKGFVPVSNDSETLALAERINKKVEAQIDMDAEDSIGYSRFFNVDE